MSLSCTVTDILLLISKNLKRSRDPKIVHRGASDARVIGLAIIVCPSVCVCVLHAGIVSKWLNVGSRKQHHVIAQGLKFSDAKIRWWMTPFPLKFALKVTHPSFNQHNFDQ